MDEKSNDEGCYWYFGCANLYLLCLCVYMCDALSTCLSSVLRQVLKCLVFVLFAPVNASTDSLTCCANIVFIANDKNTYIPVMSWSHCAGQTTDRDVFHAAHVRKDG